VAVADLDGGGDMDAFLANAKNDIPPRDTVWLNDGAGTFHQRSQRLGQGVSLAVAAGDLDGDGDLDAMADTQGGAWVWVNDGLGVFTGGRSCHTARIAPPPRATWTATATWTFWPGASTAR